MTPSKAQYIAAARAHYAQGSDDDIVIDSNPQVMSGAPAGTFVAAWVWVTKDQANAMPKGSRS